MATLGEMLAELRRDKHLTQRDLAEVLHVSVGTISNYEQDVHFPDIEKLAEIADYFHVTTDYLLGRCHYSFSTDAFAEQLVPGKSVGDIIWEIRQLPAERKEALILILNDMAFHTAVSRYGKRESG